MREVWYMKCEVLQSHVIRYCSDFPYLGWSRTGGAFAQGWMFVQGVKSLKRRHRYDIVCLEGASRGKHWYYMNIGRGLLGQRGLKDGKQHLKCQHQDWWQSDNDGGNHGDEIADASTNAMTETNMITHANTNTRSYQHQTITWKTDSIPHHHHPEGVVYIGVCLNSNIFAVSEAASRRWWCIESLFPIARTGNYFKPSAIRHPSYVHAEAAVTCAESAWRRRTARRKAGLGHKSHGDSATISATLISLMTKRLQFQKETWVSPLWQDIDVGCITRKTMVCLKL